MSFVLDNSVAMLWLLPQSQPTGLALRYNLSAYDAAYLELALRKSLPLATLDAQLDAAARQAGVPVLC
jgi:predicted nucleic acid-binding protein